MHTFAAQRTDSLASLIPISASERCVQYAVAFQSYEYVFFLSLH